MSADTATTPTNSPIEAMKELETLKAAAEALGLTLTDEILPGVLSNLDLLSQHHATICEAGTPE